MYDTDHCLTYVQVLLTVCVFSTLVAAVRIKPDTLSGSLRMKLAFKPPGQQCLKIFICVAMRHTIIFWYG
jgi:hypothetical protein